jgi:hypothetical protein
MSNFRTRILGLAAVATAFAGVSYGQLVTTPCVTAAQSNPTLRAEGQTELLAPFVVTCTNTQATATTGSVYITTSLPITSKTYTVGGVTSNEATLVVTGTGTNGTVQGVVSGTQVSFNLPVGAIPATGSATFTISNIRVNASGGGTPQVTESGVLTYNTPTGTSNVSLPAAAGGPGFILKTLGTPSLVALGTTSYTACAGNPGTSSTAPGTSFTVNISELVGGAFLTQTGEQGQVVTPPNIGTANSADQIIITLANVPGSATIYVPQTVSQTSGGTTTLTIANSTAVSSGPLANLVGLTPSSGTVTIPYTVTASAATGALTFPVPVIVQFAANSAGAQTAITVNESYGPAAAALTGPATSVPTFLASTFTPVSGSAINLCQTSLLFPFVSNQLGFDTGIVLANTSTDNLSTIPGKTSVAVPQSGTCTLSFYGQGLPATSTGVADPMGNLPTAQTHAFTLSSVAPGFQGYIIASCPFLYAHGFGFLAYNLTQNNGAVEGYLAEVLNNSRPVSATTLSSVAGTIAGGNGTVTSSNTTTSIAEPVTF